MSKDAEREGTLPSYATPDKPDEPTKAYKLGDALQTTGQKIAEIIGQTDSSGVYITVEGHIKWEYYANRIVPDRLKLAIRKFEGLTLIVRRTYRQGNRDNARRELANALRAALETPESDDPLEAFAEVESSLCGQYARKAATWHVAGAVISTLGLAGIGYLVYCFCQDEATLVAQGAIAGAVGALISVLLRIKSLEISVSQLWYWGIEGFMRTFFGAICGGFVVVLIKANIFMGLAGQNVYACYTISIVAGFSERLVPNILASIEKSQLTHVRKSG
jgi:hypothetical protein